jgi:hypothetical protein
VPLDGSLDQRRSVKSTAHSAHFPLRLGLACLRSSPQPFCECSWKRCRTCTLPAQHPSQDPRTIQARIWAASDPIAKKKPRLNPNVCQIPICTTEWPLHSNPNTHSRP